MGAAGRIRLQRCRAEGVEAMDADSAFAFGRHVHAQFGVGLVLRGAQRSASGRGPVEAVAGDLITVNPGEVHDGIPLGAQGRAWRMLYLPPEALAALAPELPGAPGAAALEFERPLLRDARLARRFTRAYAALTTDDGDRGQLAADESLLLLLRPLLHGAARDDAGVPHAIARARQRIDDDPAAALTLAALAQEAGLSRYQFLRAFDRATGLTPHAYVMQGRIQRARLLLGRGMRPAEAAAHSGFSDQSHMSRLFLRCFGIAPGAYARSRA